MAIYLARQSRFVIPSFFKSLQWGLFLLVFVLSGCSLAGDYLSGSTHPQNPSFSYPVQLSPIHIGETTKNEVRQILGKPQDVQVASLREGTREAWAYPSQGEVINPAQFIPVFGVLALSYEIDAPSFSVSFSDKGIVQGVTLREIQTYDQGSIPLYTKNAQPVELYGVNNPLVRHSRFRQAN